MFGKALNFFWSMMGFLGWAGIILGLALAAWTVVYHEQHRAEIAIYRMKHQTEDSKSGHIPCNPNLQANQVFSDCIMNWQTSFDVMDTPMSKALFLLVLCPFIGIMFIMFLFHVAIRSVVNFFKNLVSQSLH